MRRMQNPRKRTNRKDMRHQMGVSLCEAPYCFTLFIHTASLRLRCDANISLGAIKRRGNEETMKKTFFSLLDLQECNRYETLPPAFFGDLQLEPVCSAITSKYMDFDIRKYYYTIPNSSRTVRYRQEIYKDLERNSDIILPLKKYTGLLLACEKFFSFCRQAEDEIKKGSYRLLSCQKYVEALELMRDALKKARLTSEGLLEYRRLLDEAFEDPDFCHFREIVRRSFSDMEKLKLTLLVRDKEISVLEDREDQPDKAGSFLEQLKNYIRAFDVPTDDKWEEYDEAVANLFPAPLETSPLEQAVVDILRRSSPDVFRMLREFASFPFTPEGDAFIHLKNEIIFYISFYEFERQLNTFGYELSFPDIKEGGGIDITDVYDIALAWKNRFSEYRIVCNDIAYQPEKSFLVITGPNQGGKTTLARALGQSVYFMLIGLKAPCRSMNTRFFERILTHFEVEESVETGAGKLKEELRRLKPMMHMSSQNSFVILNELFTTATTYDAQIMAKKVMRHFIQNGCLGIYVTHIRELADETEQKGIQSMVAQVDKNDLSVRTFKIIPEKAEGLGYSDSIVKKYGLGYDQITERIAHL